MATVYIICMCVCRYVYVYAHIDLYIHTSIHTYIHTYERTPIYVHMLAPSGRATDGREECDVEGALAGHLYPRLHTVFSVGV